MQMMSASPMKPAIKWRITSGTEREQPVNIFERIEKDHQHQRALVEKLRASASGSKARGELLAELAAEYRAHAAAEEHAFYAPMLKISETTEQARHSVAEHHDSMEVLEALEALALDADDWMEKLEAFAHDNEHHMKEEEEDVFSKARQELPDEQIGNMLATFDARKQDELG